MSPAAVQVYLSEAAKAFPALGNITAVEKDILSGRVLTALSSSIPVPVSVQITGFEETSNEENSKSDLIISNIPFGNFRVYDDAFKDEAITGKIHNYFFAKGLDKLREGGLLAFITTDAFLNSPSNAAAREYVFHNSNFISLNVMPDNLMKDTGNTEAPSHLLILQKNSDKKDITTNEQYLIETVEKKNEFGTYSLNKYIENYPKVILGDEIKAGKNQYGRAHQTIWQNGNINDISLKLAESINEGINQRLNRKSFDISQVKKNAAQGKQLSYLPMPESKPDNSSVQLGLFDIAPAANISRASAYINNLDATVVQRQSARIVNIIKTKDKPEHEAIVMLTAKSIAFKQYAYKLYSNVDEISFPANWMNASALQYELKSLSNRLQEYDHKFYNEGEALYHVSLNKKDELETIKNPNAYHKDGTLIIHDSRVGFLSFIAGEKEQPVFIPSLLDKKDLAFYQQYTSVRDTYLSLVDKEGDENIEHAGIRNQLNESYDALIKGYGILNSSINRQRILKDEAFGFLILASLERKEGEQFLKADILTQSLIQKQEAYHTDNPVEALARSLNDKGFVDMEFIAAATGTTEPDAIKALGNHIYLNLANEQWETADRLLSGNVVIKLNIAKEEAEKNPNNAQLQRSLEVWRLWRKYSRRKFHLNYWILIWVKDGFHKNTTTVLQQISLK